jgi:hypothetical protein
LNTLSLELLQAKLHCKQLAQYDRMLMQFIGLSVLLFIDMLR